MSIIGKTYIASDNSYTMCLSEGVGTIKVQNPYFAGTHKVESFSYKNQNTKRGKPKIPAIIVSEPYKLKLVHFNDTNNTDVYEFVNVEHNGHIFRVLYHEKGVQN